jgi:hypothetical protein
MALAAVASAVTKPHWVSFKSTVLNLVVSVPSDWSPVKAPNALAFRYDDQAGGTAGIGILKSTQISSITEAVDQEYTKNGNPADWVRADARVGGMKAIKISGTDPKNTERKIVHYYVDTPRGIYLVQCQGSAAQWNTFGPIIATVLSKLTFLP